MLPLHSLPPEKQTHFHHFQPQILTLLPILRSKLFPARRLLKLLHSILQISKSQDMSGSRRRSSTHSGSPSSSQRGTIRPIDLDAGGPRSGTPVRPIDVDASGPSEERPRTQVWLKPKADGSGGFTLEPSNIVLGISKRAYQSRMNEFWPKWTLIPEHVKEAIWQEFLGNVDLQDADLSVVQRHWQTKIAKNYRETLNAIKTAGSKPNWMSDNVWEEFLKWWKHDDFTSQSERNSANRNKNPVTHRGGSKSFQHHREDLERQRGGPVSRIDVFTHMHALSQIDETGSYTYNWETSEKARGTYDKFMAARTTMLQDTGRAELSIDEENAIFESVMDPPTRGRRFGFGNQSVDVVQINYQKAQDKEEIAQLRAHIASLEERDRRREEQMAQLNNKLAEFIEQYGRHTSSGGSGGD